jgi:hypothetical protein
MLTSWGRPSFGLVKEKVNISIESWSKLLYNSTVS